MADGQHDSLGPPQQCLERVGEASGGGDAALAAARAVGARLVGPRPGAVVRERAALERAEADLVEPRLDEAGRAPAGEREGQGVVRPHGGGS